MTRGRVAYPSIAYGKGAAGRVRGQGLPLREYPRYAFVPVRGCSCQGSLNQFFSADNDRELR
jgi:hypothetical protein